MCTKFPDPKNLNLFFSCFHSNFIIFSQGYSKLEDVNEWLLKKNKVCGLQFFYSRCRCHLLLVLKQGYPFYSQYRCKLGYHQSEAWPVEQKTLPPQFYVASVTTGIQTHTLLIKHQSLNLVLLTIPPWHATCVSEELVMQKFPVYLASDLRRTPFLQTKTYQPIA